MCVSLKWKGFVDHLSHGNQLFSKAPLNPRARKIYLGCKNYFYLFILNKCACQLCNVIYLLYMIAHVAHTFWPSLSQISSLLQLTGMQEFPTSTLQTPFHIPVELAELLAFCGTGINCVNILVVLFWCVYWPNDCMHVYLAVCLRPMESTERKRLADIIVRHHNPVGLFEPLRTAYALISLIYPLGNVLKSQYLTITMKNMVCVQRHVETVRVLTKNVNVQKMSSAKFVTNLNVCCIIYT